MAKFRDPQSGKVITVEGPDPTEEELSGMFASGGTVFRATEQPKPGGLKGFGEAMMENAIPEVIRHPSMIADVPGAVRDIQASGQDPTTAMITQAGKDVVGSSVAAAKDQLAKGNALGAVGAAVPLIGPPAAQAGEEIGQGQTARGLGHAAGMLLPFAAGPAGEALARPAEVTGKAVAASTINSLIKPLEKEFRFGRNPGAGIAEEGTMAASLPSLAEKVRAKMGAVGKVIGSKLDTPEANAQLIDIKPLTAPIDEAIAKAVRVGDTATATALQNFRDSPLFTEKQFVTPAEAHEIKGVVGDSTTWTGAAYDKAMNAAKADVYRNINTAIETAVPGVKALQARYADLLSGVKSIERTANIGERASPLNLMDVATGVGIGGAMHAGPLGALGAAGLRRIITSAGSQTVMAQALRRAGLIPPLVGETIRASGTAKRLEAPEPRQ